MKKNCFLVLCLVIAVFITSCAEVLPVETSTSTEAPAENVEISGSEIASNMSHEEINEPPEDFAFSIIWGTYGISSYDSRSGKLVKTKDATDVSKYTAFVKMSKSELRTVYRCLFSDMDISKYPESYDPFNAPDAEIRMTSEPNQTIEISVTANGSTKAVKCKSIAFGSLNDCYSEEAKAFLSAEREIVNLITSFPEWNAFPDYEFFYE